MLARLFLLITFAGLFFATVTLSHKTVFSGFKLPNLTSAFQANHISLDTSVNAKGKEPQIRSIAVKPRDSYMQLREGLDPSSISAAQALVFDINSDHIIFAKDIQAKRAVASLTKIVTFLVAAENLPLDTLMTVSEKAASQEPDSMGLFPGEKLFLKQLLEGMILVSGNDSAETIAENTFGTDSRDEFVERMNDKAYYLGMESSQFKNPNGLDEEGGSGQSSSYDLMLLMREALKSPVFMEISAQREILIPENFLGPENHKNFYLGNTSPTLDYPGYISGKPGFTYDAGKCQITVAERDGHSYMAIILGSSDRKVDTETLLNWAFALPSS